MLHYIWKIEICGTRKLESSLLYDLHVAEPGDGLQKINLNYAKKKKKFAYLLLAYPNSSGLDFMTLFKKAPQSVFAYTR